MKKIIELFKTRDFRKHFLIGIASIALLLLIIFTGLGFYTRHGESVTVPDLHGLDLKEAIKQLEDQGFRYNVDSIFSVSAPAGSVFDQEPEGNEKVKEGRMIYLVAISRTPPMVKMPDLKDVSLREATAILESFGLKTGALIYKPDLAQNSVLGVLYKGNSISKGHSLLKGSAVDLILGDGYGNLNVNLPDLRGLSIDEALFVLQGSKLNMGNIKLDPGSDSTNARIYRQIPDFIPDSVIKIGQGEAIDIFLTNDKSKIIH